MHVGGTVDARSDVTPYVLEVLLSRQHMILR